MADGTVRGGGRRRAALFVMTALLLSGCLSTPGCDDGIYPVSQTQVSFHWRESDPAVVEFGRAGHPMLEPDGLLPHLPYDFEPYVSSLLGVEFGSQGVTIDVTPTGALHVDYEGGPPASMWNATYDAVAAVTDFSPEITLNITQRLFSAAHEGQYGLFGSTHVLTNATPRFSDLLDELRSNENLTSGKPSRFGSEETYWIHRESRTAQSWTFKWYWPEQEWSFVAASGRTVEYTVTGKGEAFVDVINPNSDRFSVADAKRDAAEGWRAKGLPGPTFQDIAGNGADCDPFSESPA